MLTSPLREGAVERLGWESAGNAFAFADAGVYDEGPRTSEEEGSEQFVQYSWRTTSLRWNVGDRNLMRIVEMPVTATFDAASYAADEGGTFDVTVTLPVTVAVNGGATEADYSDIPEELVFAPGDASKTFTVTVVDDA